ncbi:MAG: alpha/beta hydrolase [Planctomycetota bacterium]
MVATRDGALHLTSRGEGPDVLLLHGLGDSSVTFSRVEAGLREAGLRVHLLDALGAGRSDKPDGPYDMDSQVRRLREVLDARGIRRCIVIGNSLGGSQALLLAVEDPQRVRALCLISPAAWPKGGWTGGVLWNFPHAVEASAKELPAEWIARVALLANFGDRRRITPDLVALYAQEVRRADAVRAFVALQRQVMPSVEQVERWTSRYPSLQVPTLILWGTHDRIIDPAMGRRLTEVLPDARLVPLEGAGHAAQLEVPDLVLRETLGFLRERGLLRSR